MDIATPPPNVEPTTSYTVQFRDQRTKYTMNLFKATEAEVKAALASYCGSYRYAYVTVQRKIVQIFEHQLGGHDWYAHRPAGALLNLATTSKAPYDFSRQRRLPAA